MAQLFTVHLYIINTHHIIEERSPHSGFLIQAVGWTQIPAVEGEWSKNSETPLESHSHNPRSFESYRND